MLIIAERYMGLLENNLICSIFYFVDIYFIWFLCIYTSIRPKLNMSDSFGAFDVGIPFSADLRSLNAHYHFLRCLLVLPKRIFQKRKEVHDKSSYDLAYNGKHMSSIAPYYPTLMKKQTNRVKEIERGGVVYVILASEQVDDEGGDLVHEADKQ